MNSYVILNEIFIAVMGWVVEIAWEGVALIRAVLSGGKIGIGIGIGSLLFSGDDTIKKCQGS